VTSEEIRESFLGYFERNGHKRIPSSPVITWGDPTLMFTNAGMNQFKDVFLGLEKRDYNRATTCQKCIRAGGKHNDLDEVGKTTRHGTFLEMLGNFSFGDYFKERAIGFAWEYLTGELGFSPDELYVSVYTTDDEAFTIWNKVIGVSKNRILRFGNIEDQMTPLPKPSIDTGLGLERIAMLKQGKENIFETDILGKLVNRLKELSGKTYEEKTGMPFRVAADHVRTLTFAIADGAIPSNEGRGYVLRRILRRASRHLRELDVHEPMLFRMVSDVVDLMGDAYPEIYERAEYISLVIKGEEERFLKTLDMGIDLFEQLVTDVQARNARVIGGYDAFKLYDTYGFPVDLTRIMAEEKDMTVDMAGFEKAMETQRERAREASAFAAVEDDGSPWNFISGEKEGGSVFVGYETDSVRANLLRYRLNEKRGIELVFDKTPFYAISGGQVNDTGTIVPADNSYSLIVKDVYDLQGVGRVHTCDVMNGKFSADAFTADSAVLTIDSEKRRDTERNHSATHLLQAGLQKILGPHVRQSGSAVDSERLRFDFNHFSAMTAEEIEDVEDFVNRTVIENHQATITENSLEEARKMGAMSLFDEKYSDRVRMIKMGDVSLELCGGTHVSSTGNIGLFRILSEASVAAGIRRIEAVTGMHAYELAKKEHKIISALSRKLNIAFDEIVERVDNLAVRIRDNEKEIKRLRTQGMFGSGADISSQSVEVNGVKVVYSRMEASDTDELKVFVDSLRETLGSGVGVLGAAINGKVSIVATVTDDLIKNRSLRAGDIVKKVAERVNGSGGGRAHMAMAGGKDVAKLDEALASVPGIIEQLLK